MMPTRRNEESVKTASRPSTTTNDLGKRLLCPSSLVCVDVVIGNVQSNIRQNVGARYRHCVAETAVKETCRATTPHINVT
jgi:hypothetical protein